jgi:DNA invertase Pin-like site-specific DNA recombinase
MDGKFVAYYRVGTQKQAKSSLGLEAQKAAVLYYLNGGGWKLLAEFTEIESGKHDDRPELAKALVQCKKKKATLVIAKLDRLSRNVAFIARLMEGKVPSLAVDMPEANELTIHILAAVAQHERRMISTRIKEALQVAKAKGKHLETGLISMRLKGSELRPGLPVLINSRPRCSPLSARSRRAECPAITR